VSRYYGMLEAVPRTFKSGRLVQCRKTKQAGLITRGPYKMPHTGSGDWYEITWYGNRRPFTINNVSEETFTNLHNTVDILS